MRRILGRWDSVAIIIAVAVGVGIFRVPAEVAQLLGAPALIILAWAVGGLISFLGALCYAELSSSFPETGGNYIYLRESYGPLSAFLYGWAELTVVRTGSIAAVSFVCAEYLQSFLGASPHAVKPIAICIVMSVSFVNIFGLKYGKKLQDAATVAKIAGLAFIVVFAVWSQSGDVSNFHSDGLAFDVGVLPSFALALVPILWTYGGWHENTFVAGETKDAGRTLPTALVTGSLTLTAAYLIMNCTYIYLLPVQEMAKSQLIGSDVMEILCGATGRKLFEVLVIVFSLGCINAMVITGGRVTYAMARGNALFGYLGEINTKYGTPHRAIFINAVWSVGLIIVGTFNELLFFTGILVWLFFGLVAGCVFMLRHKFPDIHRPYRVWGYPFVPVIFAVVCLALCVNTAIFYTLQSLAGMGLLVSGIPMYILGRRNEAKRSGERSAGGQVNEPPRHKDTKEAAPE